ncbi:35554_t:CDS:2 [Racocetra persica]|uniref:35554_t:CDS:1 n=1 Tax=Racocetra persica TaxID=160502 RepID=A0ACA9M1Q9_9GLOM|nr:35554_t:CDS:2 [Racocetra persica]
MAELLRRTKKIKSESSEKQKLFLISKTSYTSVKEETLDNWIKKTLKEADIDIREENTNKELQNNSIQRMTPRQSFN